MKSKITVFVILALSALLLSPMAVLAQVWTHVASAAAVDEGSLSSYDANAAEFKHKGASTGAIYARCNVTSPSDGGSTPFWSALEVTYRDPDGSGTANQVTATLYRVSNSALALSTVATFNSNSFGASSLVQTKSVGFSHSFDFYTGAYYVVLKVNRTSSSASNNPAILIVRLTNIIESPQGRQNFSIPETGLTAETDELETGPPEINESEAGMSIQNYPNPFNPSTSIQFEVKQAGLVTLKVYNSLGQEVATLVDENLSAGRHTATFDATGLPSGVYFYKLSMNGISEVKKMELIR